jgi:hypothetical protein
MSAFGGKADMTLCGNPLLRSLLGVKRTCLLHRICPLMTQSGHQRRCHNAIGFALRYKRERLLVVANRRLGGLLWLRHLNLKYLMYSQ